MVGKPKHVDNVKPIETKQPRTGFVQFTRETIAEMRKVRWPKRREVVNYTTAALLTCLVLGLLVWVFDLGVDKVMTLMGIL